MVSRAVKIGIVAVLVVIVVVAGLYFGLTYPMQMVDVQVSLTAGVDSQTKQFQMPVLQDKAQVQVTVTSGTVLWSVRIVASNGSQVYSYTATTSAQTTYTSQWITLPQGTYNVTMQSAGIGSLSANMKVTTKGGIW
jgi:hypothetical protein